MAAYQAHPMAHHMGPVPTNPGMVQPTGSMPPQMHPGMRPGLPTQGGPMIPPGMSMGPGGMNTHAMSHLQPNMFVGNPQMSQGQAFQQAPPHMMANQQQAILRQRQLAQSQQQNPGLIMGSGHQMTMNPASLQALQQMRGANMPQYIQQQMVGQPDQQRHGETHNRPNQAMMQHLAFQNAGNQQIHPGQAPQMRPQPSLQGMRDHMVSGAPQQPGQQPAPQMPPQTPQNAQLQRPRPPPPSVTHAQHPNQPHPTALPGQQQSAQPTPQQQQAQLPPQHQGTPQMLNQQQSRQPTPQNLNAQPAGMVSSQQKPQQNIVPQNPATSQAEVAVQTNAQQQQQIRENEQRNMQHMAQLSRQSMLAQKMAVQHQQAQATALRLQQFCQVLNTLSSGDARKELVTWQQFVSDFFTEDGVFRIQSYHSTLPHFKDSQVCTPLLARYFLSHFMNGIKRIQVSFGAGDLNEMDAQNSDEVPTIFTYYFENGTQSVASGALRAIQIGGKLCLLEFLHVRYEDYLPRQLIEKAVSPDISKSPEKTKSAKQKSQQRNTSRTVDLDRLPQSQSGEYGMNKGLQQFLETAETMSAMRSLFDFHNNNLHLRPHDALAQLVDSYRNKPSGQGQNMFQQPQLANPYAFGNSMMGQANGGLHTPGPNGPPIPGNLNYFQSPAQPHPNLPNTMSSPHIGGQHTPSPNHHANMQAPPMMAQHSHQGITTQSATASSNASPNVPGKRRRQSLAKLEGTESGDLNGMAMSGTQGAGQNKVKASPRPGKKQKGNS